ncbi:MAG: hypothetical protein WD768_13985 [Phycisphaeraceae bacterium]
MKLNLQPFLARLNRALAASLLLFGLVTSAVAQEKDKQPAAPPPEVRPEVKGPFAGQFSGDDLSMTIEHTGKTCKGKIIKAGKPFEFTGTAEGNALQGSFSVGGAKSNFSATIIGDELTLTLGFDAYKLSRAGATPVVKTGVNTVRKEVLLIESAEVLNDTEVVSPSNRRIAFVILRDGLRYAVLDGVEGKPYRRIGGLVFSPDSSRLSYIAKRSDGKVLVVVDEKESEDFDALGRGPATFSPDGKRLAFAGLREGKWRVLIDGEAGEAYEAIGAILFSPDSKRVAYPALKEGKWRAVVDGQEHAAVTEIGRNEIIFSPDSKHVAYAAIDGNQQNMMVDGIPGRTFDGITGFGFSENGRRTAYVALRNRQCVLVVDGQEKATYEHIQGVSMDKSGKTLAIGIRRDRQAMLVINDVEQPEFDNVEGPQFSPIGGRIAYLAQKDNKWSVMMADGTPASKPHDRVDFLSFSPDGKRLAYVAVDKKLNTVHLDDETLGGFDEIWEHGLLFSPDSKHVLFGAHRETRSLLVIDGIGGEDIGTLLPGSKAVFDKADELHIITRRGTSYQRLDVRILR